MSYMKPMLVVLLALWCCVEHFSEGAVFVKTFPEHPDHPGKCYDPKLKQAVDQGEAITDHTECTRLRCSQSRFDPPEYSFSGETCSYTPDVPANCQVIDGDLSEEFPDCCSRVECDGAPDSPIISIG